MPALLEALTAATADTYVVERELGRGGMGAVFLARDRALDRRVAIKVLPPELAARADLRERFLRETRTAAAFSHPNIVPVHAVEERQGLLLLVMGYVDGETLAARVGRAGPLGAVEATRLLREVAWALSYAHSQNVVHRDVKPDNILLERATGRALVTDFGIAKAAGAAAVGGRTLVGLTVVGEVVGTPQFMSPEQAAGDVVDGRSDLYALGLVGFFALTGRVPFDGPSTASILAQQLTRPAPDLAALRPELPEELAAAVQRCVAKDPAERFQGGEALVAALDALRAARPDVAPALRLFDQRAHAALRGVAILALLTPVMVASMGNASVDALVAGGFLLTVMSGLVRSVVAHAGELARQGFRYADPRAGVLALESELRADRAALRALPGDAARERRQRFGALAAVLLGVACEAVVRRSLRRPLGDGRYVVSPPGIVLSVCGIVLIAGAIITIVTDPRRASVWEWLSARLWSGRIGAALFRFAARRHVARAGAEGAAPARPAAGGARAAGTMTPGTTTLGGAPGGATTVGRTPLDLFDALPKTRRAELHGLRGAIAQLEAEAARLAAREAELDTALAEARTGGGWTDGAGENGDARRDALLDDLARARRDAGAERAQLVAGVEHVRLQLIRVRSGLAGRDELAAEIPTLAAR